MLLDFIVKGWVSMDHDTYLIFPLGKEANMHVEIY
jgi:hypothetical protein